MGEWSKKVGERGEEIVGDFLSLIGWANCLKGITIPCQRKQHLNDSDKPKNTHGVDYLYSYNTPFEHTTLINALISVKFTSNDYPKNPRTLFKSHFYDLAQTTDCFRFSDVKNDISKDKSNSSVRDIGVLFWLSNNTQTTLFDGQEQSVIKDVESTQKLNEFIYSEIYIVDNKQIAFVYDSIVFAKRIFDDEKHLKFFYPDSGLGVMSQDKVFSGSVLPVEHLVSPILAFAGKIDSLTSLVISSRDTFEADSLKSLISFSHNISSSMAQNITIAFPDYDPLHHANEVELAKSGFKDQDFVQNVTVISYYSDFRG